MITRSNYNHKCQQANKFDSFKMFHEKAFNWTSTNAQNKPKFICPKFLYQILCAGIQTAQFQKVIFPNFHRPDTCITFLLCFWLTTILYFLHCPSLFQFAIIVPICNQSLFKFFRRIHGGLRIWQGDDEASHTKCVDNITSSTITS